MQSQSRYPSSSKFFRGALLFALLAAFALYGLSALGAPGQIAFAAGTITGTVFRDYDADGLQDPREPGIGGITITAYTAAGTSVGTTTYQFVCAGSNSPASVGCTGAGAPALGSYSLNTGSIAAGPYRLEMTFTQTYLQTAVFSSNSAGNKTSVRFVNDGAQSGVNFAVSDPSQYAGTTVPRLVTNAYVWGAYNNATASGETAMYSWNYDFTNAAAPAAATDQGTSESTHNQIGSTFGLAYRRSNNTLYISAYLKRLAGFGPGLGGTDGSGTIYAVTPNSTGTDNGTAYIDLDTGGDTTGSNLHSAFDCGAGNSCDANAFTNVGKASLGDLEISGDESKMWTVNLLNKHLIEIQFAGPTIVDRGVIPAPTCTSGVARPSALGWNDGLLYVGGVCDASTGGNAANLSAYVYPFDPATNTFGASVISFPLNYTRTCLNRDTYGGVFPVCNSPLAVAVNAPSALWHAWTDTIGTIMQSNVTYQGTNGSGDRTGGYAQPILSDIVFDNTDMILGFRDRTGDMLGFNEPGPNGINPLLSGNPNERTIPGGDILRASPNGAGGWTIESNSASNPTGIFGATGGATTYEGPNNGEFYYQDTGPASNGHRETSLGGLVQVPGYSEVALTAYSPINASTIGSIQLYNTGATAGQRERYIQVVGSTNNGNAGGNAPAGNGSNFSKTNGLGDLEAIILPAPLQLGNRVWNDTDGDGLQDPGEAGISGVTVQIYEGATFIGSTTTDSTGEWYFTSSTAGISNWGTDGIPNTADDTGANLTTGLKPTTNGFTHTYQIRIDPTVGSNATLLTGYALTTLNAPQPANGNISATNNNPVKDIADSDASLSSNINIINYTTGGIGVNNHGLDFGFTPRFSIGNRVWIDNGAGGGTVNNGIMDGTEAGINSVGVSLYQDSNGDGVPDGAAIATTTTANGGYYNFANLASGKYLVGINAANFNSGQPLFGFYSSSGVKANDKADKGLDRSNPAASTYGILTTTLTMGPGDNAPTGTAETDFTTGQTQGGTQNNTTDARANLQIDFGFQSSTPTATDFGILTADRAENGVLVQWNSLNEINVLSFNVLRSDSKQGTYAVMNDAPIAALSVGQINGNAYQYADTAVQAGATYWYRIEILRVDASTFESETVSVKVKANTGCGNKLDAPLLLTPARETKLKAGKVEFTWQTVDCAKKYQIEIRADSPGGQRWRTSKLTKPPLA